VGGRILLRDEQRLVLRDRQLTDRLGSFFVDLDHDRALQRSFIDSPAEVLGGELAGRSLSVDQAAAVNQFVYSALANEDLRAWAETYDREHPEADRNQRLRDFGEAMARFGDAPAMHGLLDMVSSGVGFDHLADSALIVKQDSVAVGNWFIVKVSGTEDLGAQVLPAEQIQRISQQMIARAQELSAGGQL